MAILRDQRVAAQQPVAADGPLRGPLLNRAIALEATIVQQTVEDFVEEPDFLWQNMRIAIQGNQNRYFGLH